MIIFLLSLLFVLLQANSFSVMSYNIRGYIPCDNLKRPSHHFYYRQNYLIDIIKEENPDILGVQEVFNIPPKKVVFCNKQKYIGGYEYDFLIQKDIKELKQQKIYITPKKHLIRDFIRERLSLLGYASFYKKGGSPKIIFYKPSKFDKIEGGVFYQNKVDRKLTTYLFLKKRGDNRTILVLNTHLISGKKYQKVRKKSIDFIVAKIKSINKNQYPVIIMGDFNIKFNSKEFNYMKNRFKEIGLVYSNDEYTYNGFGSSKEKIDYVFYSFDKLDKISVEVNRKIFYKNGLKLFPSDHYPIKVQFKFKDEHPNTQTKKNF